jgi:uncharacterized metal-binding protein YceD (DUF177 family)
MARKSSGGGKKTPGKTPEKTPGPEFVREIEVAALNGERREFDVTATQAEMAALATRFGVDGIVNLSARVLLSPFASGNKVALKARFVADVAQTCVVTLEPLTNRIEGEFFAEFVQRAFTDKPDEIEFGIDDDDPPEPIVDGRIEFGELIAQNLGLLIDPFPRAPGAVFEAVSIGEEEGTKGAEPAPDDERPNPFAVLERLKTQKN